MALAGACFILTFMVCEPGKYLPRFDATEKSEDQNQLMLTDGIKSEYQSLGEKIMNPFVQQPTEFTKGQKVHEERHSNVIRPSKMANYRSQQNTQESRMDTEEKLTTNITPLEIEK